MEVLKSALSSIKPTKEEEKNLRLISNNILAKINSCLVHQKAVLGGSGIKGTWLKNQHDIDIFVMFDYKRYQSRSKELPDILEEKLKKMFPDIRRLHGSRDYFQIRKENFDFEIIPILNIKSAEQANNITDVSPLHARWVKQHKELSDDIRLMKQFSKSAGVYGAESYIRGFSGYICEILVIKYGSFLKLIKNAAKWDSKVIIDTENYYRKKNLFKILSPSKTYSPLIVIDPVQRDRNAAAAISTEKFERFKVVCRKFLKKSSIEFFIEKSPTVESIKKLSGGNILALFSAKPMNGKVDIVGSKLLKVYEYLAKRFIENEFKILKNGWHWNGKGVALFYFIFKENELPKLKKHIGPLISLPEHVVRFKDAHKETFIEGNRICSYVKREFISPEKLALNLMTEAYVKERVSSITIQKISKTKCMQ